MKLPKGKAAASEAGADKPLPDPSSQRPGTSGTEAVLGVEPTPGIGAVPSGTESREKVQDQEAFGDGPKANFTEAKEHFRQAGHHLQERSEAEPLVSSGEARHASSTRGSSSSARRWRRRISSVRSRAEEARGSSSPRRLLSERAPGGSYDRKSCRGSRLNEQHSASLSIYTSRGEDGRRMRYSYRSPYTWILIPFPMSLWDTGSRRSAFFFRRLYLR